MILPLSVDPLGQPDQRFPDLRNLRDLGGLRTEDGRRVRSGVLYRSATPLFVDAEQARLLVDLLGIRTRIDLRSHLEVEESHNEPLSSRERAVAHLPLRAGEVWHPNPDLTDPEARVAEHYLCYLERSPDSITEMVRVISDQDRTPVLVHCTAGKDRTGVALAVVLSAAGVAPEQIVADYARTRDDLDPLFLQLRSLPAYAERIAELPEESLSAEPRSMELFLDRVDEVHAGVTAYLSRRGVGDEVLQRLQRVLLEDCD